MASKTMSLDPQEWRALVISNLVTLHQFIMTGTTPLNDAEGIWFQNQLDRLKYQASAWQASARPAEQVQTMDAASAKPQAKAKNGAAETQVVPIPKKRGRPKKIPIQAHQ